MDQRTINGLQVLPQSASSLAEALNLPAGNVLPPTDQPSTNGTARVGRPPYRSPFRYPGGKNWLVRYISEWLNRLSLRPAEFVEPFAGGGSVGLAVALGGFADRVTMVELDEQVAAVWDTILNDEGGAQWLVERIVAFDPTPEALDALLAEPDPSRRQLAFRTIVRNRVNRGGILTRRAGRLNKGEKLAKDRRKGLRSRWYPDTLKQRILDIAASRDRIAFIEGDGLALLRQKADQESTVFFIDPPYIVGGRQLYTRFDLDHVELFRVVSGLIGDFLLTYDDVPQVHDLAAVHGFDLQAVPVHTTHHKRKSELVVGRNLAWLREILPLIQRELPLSGERDGAEGCQRGAGRKLAANGWGEPGVIGCGDDPGEPI